MPFPLFCAFLPAMSPRVNLEKTVYGVPIKKYGARLVATFSKPRGQGRQRKTAPATVKGLQALEAWATAAVRSAAGAKTLTPGEIADATAALAELPEGQTLLSPWGKKAPDSVSPADAEGLVRLHKSPVTQNTVRRQLVCFYNWLRRHHYAAENPFESVATATADEKAVDIYKPGDVAKLFAKAEETAPALIPAMALEFFAGVRTSGVERMRPADLRQAAGEICLPGWASKTRRAYFAPMNATLQAWLAAYPPRGCPPHGVVMPLSLSRWHKALRRLHADAEVSLVPNGARHSFATYLYARNGDAVQTACALGHFGNPQTLARHYRGLADAEAAKAYFAVLPGKVGLKLVYASRKNAKPAGRKSRKNLLKNTKTHQ